jgi:hypothetical protein
MKKLIASLLPTFVVALAPAGARAETNSCTPITSVPVTLYTSGIYCLTSDIVTNITSGYAITINAPHVVLDLNAHRLSNSAGSTNNAGAIYSSQPLITIRNGAIRGFGAASVNLRGGFFNAISKANLVEDLHIDQTAAGIISDPPALVRRNWITGVQAKPGDGASEGILLEGYGSRVIDNDILGVTPPPDGDAYGILVVGLDTLVVNNRITDSPNGIYFGASGGKYRDNLTTSVTTPYSGWGTDAGNNN